MHRFFHPSVPQGDRHSENAFMAEDGYLKLIDTRDGHLSVDVRMLTHTFSHSFTRARTKLQPFLYPPSLPQRGAAPTPPH